MRSYGSGGRARVIESIRIRINSFSFFVCHGEGLRVRFHVDFLSSLASSPLTIFHLPQHGQPHCLQPPSTTQPPNIRATPHQAACSPRSRP